LNGDCITECSSSLQREREDEFCIPSTGPSSQICDNTVQICCKNKTGAIVGISIAGGLGLLMIAGFVIYLTQGSKEQQQQQQHHRNDDNNKEKGEETSTEP
jgi:hypothetical protein